MKATGELLLNESPSAHSVYSKKVRLVGMKRSLSLDSNFIATNRTKAGTDAVLLSCICVSKRTDSRIVCVCMCMSV